MSALEWISPALQSLSNDHLRRTPAIRAGSQRATLLVDGRECINFASNDYLGLAADPRLAAAAAEAIANEGIGAGASPLIVGRSPSHARLEARLAEFEGCEAALLFSSGFAANLGTIPALVERGDEIFSDRLCHASLIDGCRLSRATVRIFPHNDARMLARMLAEPSGARRRLIVVESVFSMDGDLAPLVELVELAEQHGAMLLVDEAHACGVFGKSGRGLAESAGVADRISIRIGTLSKALGCAGGFVCGSRDLIDWLYNRARSYVFSTAPPPAVAAAAVAAIDVVRDEPQRRLALLANAASLREELSSQGWNLAGSASQIVPLVVGEPTRALELSQKLRQRGLIVPAIRPPTVPAGESRLRISLSCEHTPAMIANLVEALGEAARA